MQNNEITMTCILCPRGCILKLTETDEYIVEGGKCNKGKDYAIKEITNPTRMLTSTVKTSFKDFPRLPVRTDNEIPLRHVFKYMNEINKIIVEKRLKPGDIIIKNILNSEANLIATDDMTINE